MTVSLVNTVSKSARLCTDFGWLNSPHSPLLCPWGLHNAKELHDFFPALTEMLQGSAEPACLLLMTTVQPKALRRFQKTLSPLQDLALVLCNCVMTKKDKSVTKSLVLSCPCNKKNGKLYITCHEAVHSERAYSDSLQFFRLLCTNFVGSDNDCAFGIIWSSLIKK